MTWIKVKGHNIRVTPEIQKLMDMFGKPIGSGICRLVFDMGDGFVFKYSMGKGNKVWERQNHNELMLYERFGIHLNFLLPVESFEVEGISGIRAPKCEAVVFIPRSCIDAHEKIRDDMCGYEPNDGYQVGLWEGKFWLIDYGIEENNLRRHVNGMMEEE